MQEYLGIVFWQFLKIFLNKYVNIRDSRKWKKFAGTNINVVAIISSPKVHTTTNQQQLFSIFWNLLFYNVNYNIQYYSFTYSKKHGE